MHAANANLTRRIKELGQLAALKALLDWDQEVIMPQGGMRARAEQMALIAGLAHQRLVCDETRALLDEVVIEDGDFVTETNVRRIRRQHERAARIPQPLIEDIARHTTVAREAWQRARQGQDFAPFAPDLTRLIDLERRVAEHVGYSGEPYDAMLDEFEPGATARALEPLFAALKDATVALLRRIRASDTHVEDGVLRRHYPQQAQERIAAHLARRLGFDASAGRLDISTHPFCTTVGGSGDIRLTTRYDEHYLPSSLFGILHEIGHALYEQGLPADHAFTPMAEAVSLGIHESQSRLWENFIGRGMPFWQCHYDELRAAFPDALGDVPLQQFYEAVNAVRSSPIRVESDELSYNLHVILRFEIERALFDGSLNVVDLPAAWDAKMESILDIRPANASEGCLQDIHWSTGAFGYFPTYTLGNLYAAQFYEQARKDIDDLDDTTRSGRHDVLRDWLRTHIHRHGQRFRADELVECITGRPLSIDSFVNYATEKFGNIYHLNT